MKILSLLCLASVLLAFHLAPVPQTSTSEKNFSYATVDRTEAIYVFIFSKPANQYDVIGTFDVKQKFTGEPKEQLKTALAKLHEKYPGAEGIIFTGGNMQSAEAITFRK